jgi:hypothetical protein
VEHLETILAHARSFSLSFPKVALSNSRVTGQQTKRRERAINECVRFLLSLFEGKRERERERERERRACTEREHTYDDLSIIKETFVHEEREQEQEKTL